jgi:hypothetical protein
MQIGIAVIPKRRLYKTQTVVSTVVPSLPIGQITRVFCRAAMSSPVLKNISLSPTGKSSLELRAVPARLGALRGRHETLGQDAVDVNHVD